MFIHNQELTLIFSEKTTLFYELKIENQGYVSFSKKCLEKKIKRENRKKENCKINIKKCILFNYS